MSYELISAVDGKEVDFTTTNANASNLSATSTLGLGNKTNISVLYENRHGDTVMIRGTPSPVSFKWRDISPGLPSTAKNVEAPFSFSSGSTMDGRSEIIVITPENPSNHDSYIFTYQNGTCISGKSVFLPGTERFLPNVNDGGTYILSINKTEGMMYLSSVETSRPWHDKFPCDQFPFSKAAALYSHQNETLFVYHQTINLSIAKQIWEGDVGRWFKGTWIDYDD